MDAMPTAVRCGTLIDGTGADPVRGATLVFEGDTIVSVSRTGEVPRDADLVDAAHLTIMPGMIDAHVHVNTGGVTEAQRTLIALANAQIDLAAGFTTVVERVKQVLGQPVA